MTDINFNAIRPYLGTRHGGFEELCCQLARLETPKAKSFHRKGPGADAGVECFAVMPDGTEAAWQTKYFMDGFGQIQLSQLDKSIKHALEKHKKLARYVVCLPRNLRDPAVAQTELLKWTAWKKKWEAKAKATKRSLTIDLWDKFELGLLLSRDDANYTGRLSYWFDEHRFTSAWFKRYFDITKEILGTRYTPETNVEIPLRKTLAFFSRDVSVPRAVERWIGAIQSASRDVLRHQPYEPQHVPPPRAYRLINGRNDRLVEGLSQHIDEIAHLNVTRWQRDINKARMALRLTRHWIWKVPESEEKRHGSSPRHEAMHYILKMIDVLDDIQKELAATDWRHINERKLLIQGPAGIGKSHILADAAEHSLERGHPAIIIAGHTFDLSEPWRQIMNYVDYPPTKQIRDFLGALDASAEAARTRAVIYIDALNERNGPDIWPNHLVKFLAEAMAFERVAVVLSCRTTYVHKTIPDGVLKGLPVITHQGFKDHAAVAAQKYLNMRGISLASTPNLAPEFTYPLFLKTCCDYLIAEKKTEFPKGLRGVSKIFEFYLNAICSDMEKKMGLDKNKKFPRRALDEFIKLCIANKSSYIPKAAVMTAFDGVLPYDGSVKKSLLTHFEAEGILTIEPGKTVDADDIVRFTFERLSDFEIASHLMGEHLDPKKPMDAFASGTVLHTLLNSDKGTNIGVIEAIAVILPEMTNLELPDVMTAADFKTRMRMKRAFRSSLLFRSQRKFTDKTRDWVNKLFQQDMQRDIWISLATEPENKFNALRLHKVLSKFSLPDLDYNWTIYINTATEEENSSIATLITWLREGGLEHLEDDRAELAAITISWLFSASNRYARDYATKALARLLRQRLHVGGRLLERFKNVTDPYILERVLAGIYGAVLQGADNSRVAELAETVYKQVFSAGTPPVNILTRDYARGIIEYAMWQKLLPSTVDLAKCRPPYKSAWVDGYVTQAELDSYVQTYRNGPGRDEIVGSVINDGDFARYVIDPAVDDWNPAPIGAEKAYTSGDIFNAWLDDFQKFGSEAQHRAFIELIELAKNLKSEIWSRSDEDDAKIKEAEKKLQATMTPDEWGRFRAEAQLKTRSWGSPGVSSVAKTNTHWARRWICKRAHDLGWTDKLFGEYDGRRGGYDRNDHHNERIGKKYQWIALYELAARLADNKLFLGNGWRDEVSTYDGPWDEPHLRNIDPSLLAPRTHYDGWKSWDRTWWTPVQVDFAELTHEEQLDWLDLDTDDLGDETVIDIADPKTGKHWLSVDAYARWNTKSFGDNDATSSRDASFQLDCRVVRKSDFTKLIGGLKGASITDSNILNEDSFSGDSQFVGEYPWHPSFRAYHEHNGSYMTRWGIPIYPTVTRYGCEKGSYDHSMEETISLKVPSAWLIGLMRLRFSDGDSLEYIDKKGDVAFFDPSVRRPGPSAGLVAREAFLKAVEKADCVPIWIVAREKSVYGNLYSHRGFGGRRLITRVYWLEDGKFKHIKHVEPSYPSKEQLKEFLGKDPPARYITRDNASASQRDKPPSVRLEEKMRKMFGVKPDPAEVAATKSMAKVAARLMAGRIAAATSKPSGSTTAIAKRAKATKAATKPTTAKAAIKPDAVKKPAKKSQATKTVKKAVGKSKAKAIKKAPKPKKAKAQTKKVKGPRTRRRK